MKMMVNFHFQLKYPSSLVGLCYSDLPVCLSARLVAYIFTLMSECESQSSIRGVISECKILAVFCFSNIVKG